jgi:DNA-binding CsgD family transcriptional regulator
MTRGASAPQLIDRRDERAVLDDVVASVRSGTSRALVLRGEAGVGKTALLEYLRQRATDCTIASAVGVESEMELAFAGLHQLCAPFLDRLDRAPGPQRAALGTAFGLRDGEPPDRFLVGLGVLSLLAAAAEDRPLVCIIDDAQWLDSASEQALAFVARRLKAEAVGLVSAVRDPSEARALEGLTELVVRGFADADAQALLESVVAGPLDERVRARILSETRGNPLALIELPRGRTPAELAGGFGLPGAPALSGRIEECFLERLAGLPSSTRLLLLIAAADPVGDALLVWRAAAELGIGPEAAGPATEAGLVDLGSQVSFRHPLVRSAVYRAGAPDERQRVHRALAEATDADIDPDRRAWHRAQATAGLDEGVATDLEQSAGRARARGGLAAGAAFLERAVELTPDPVRRSKRALLAAQAKHQAGAPEAVLRLLATAEAGQLDELERGRAKLLRAQVAFARSRGHDAPPLFLEAAKRFEPLDATLARETYLDAFAATLSADRLVRGGEAREIAAAVLDASWEPSTRACDQLLDGLALLASRGYAAAAPPLKDALRAFQTEALSEEDQLRWLWLACHVARALGDDAAWDDLTARQVQVARRAGAFSQLPVALSDRVAVELFCGRFAAATSLAAEVDAVLEATGSHLTLCNAIALAHWCGRDAEADVLTEAHRQDALYRGEGLWITFNEFGSALCYNGLGRYGDALAAAARAADGSRGFGPSISLLSELIEAAVRSGEPERAADALAELGEIAVASGTSWALGTHARGTALCATGAAAEGHYQEAIDRVSDMRTPGSTLARTRLVYGEWLRRENRRSDAREELRAAHAMLAEMGMEAFADRARRELMATGETVRKRSVETVSDLTPQELQMAQLAADGHTNPEIGAQVFLSHRTVEWHLRKVFAKLGINSRKELRPALANIRTPKRSV